MPLPSFVYANIPDSLAPSFYQISILAIFSLIALAARCSVAIISRPKEFRFPSDLVTFARFFYASFLKPHNGDGAITGQQAALESFYKAQVVSPLAALTYGRYSLGAISLATCVSQRPVSSVIIQTIESNGAS